jgi:hypothetical protein
MTDLDERTGTSVDRSGRAVVRPGRPSDAKSFLEAFRSVAEERRFIQTERVDRTPRFYRRRFRRPWSQTAAHLVAVEDDRVVGGLSIHRLDDHSATKHVATFGMFVVSVYPHNEPARALYRKFGFVEEGRLVRHAKKSYGYEDEILMALWLGPPP